MGPYKYITVHCSATPPSAVSIGVEEIREMHLKRGFSDIGYHLVINRNGKLEVGRSLSIMGAHVKGHNENNVGVCLVGGVDENGKPENNFTEDQFTELRRTINNLTVRFRIVEQNILGHRDWYTDCNGDGIVDSRDWLKVCPSFDVREKLKEWSK